MADPDLAKPEQVQVWREAMAQLRYLNDEVWKRFQFFTWLQLIFLALAVSSMARYIFVTALCFAVALFMGLVNRHILRRNRAYYLQMLARKSLLEDELGMYAQKFPGTETDHAFPWRLTPEVVQRIKQNPEAWVESSVRPPGTIAQPLFWTVELLIALNVIGVIVAVINIFRYVSHRL